MSRHLTHKADANHWQIIHDFAKAGFVVEDIHNGGLADILVKGYQRPWIFEIKVPGKRKKLTKAQEIKHALWESAINVIESAAEGIAIMQKEAFR